MVQPCGSGSYEFPTDDDSSHQGPSRYWRTHFISLIYKSSTLSLQVYLIFSPDCLGFLWNIFPIFVSFFLPYVSICILGCDEFVLVFKIIKTIFVSHEFCDKSAFC
ncbi:hypothetical protein CsSME_00032271 [Camellia sinensis var. sinensis]